jgi:hypothetical protein
VYNLVTKKLRNEKPSLADVSKSLKAMKKHCLINKVKNIAMPRIGSGRDRLNWKEVKAEIEKTFGDTEVHISVYSLPPPTRKPRLIIGDSMLRHVGESCPEAGITSFPGIRINQMAYQLEVMKMQNERPEAIVIHVGTNDIRRRNNAEEIGEDLKTLLRSGIKLFPTAKWAVSGVLYRRDMKVEYIDVINQAMSRACINLNCLFVNSCERIEAQDLGRDGLHLNRSGTEKLGKLFSEVLKKLTNRGN